MDDDSQKQLEKLLDKATQSEALELKIRVNAEKKTARTYNEDPSTAHSRAWDLAKQRRAELQTELERKYGLSDPDDAAPETRPMVFKLAKEVAAFLRSEGFKTSVRGVYDHVAKGKLRKSKDGTFLRQDVERYAVRHLPRLDGGSADKHTETLQKEKLQADVRRAIEDARLKRLRADLLDGKLVPAEQYEQALAARAALFKRALNSWCHNVVDRIIEICNGDPKKAPALLDVLLTAVREYLNQFATDQEFVADVEEARAFLEAARAAEVPK